MKRILFQRKRRFLCFAVFLLFLAGCLVAFRYISSSELEEHPKSKFHPKNFEEIRQRHVDSSKVADAQKSDTETGNISAVAAVIEREIFHDREEYSLSTPNYNVHIFYYAWYGNPAFDGKYIHWNHRLLPHWNRDVAKHHKQGQHIPPNDIGSNFYPSLGPYSSTDPKVIDDHMRQMRAARVGVIVLSWYPPGKSDSEGVPSDSLVTPLLNAAANYNLKITLHIEPYEGRDDQTVHDDVKYIIDKYSKHTSFYKYRTNDGQNLPMLYIYDSYHTPAESWAQLMMPYGSHSVRHTPYDCIFIALMVEMGHRKYIEIGGFDGFYTYFATDKFTYGSTWRYWPKLQSIAKQTNSLFIPSVGPGYIDTNIRPWNHDNMRLRNDGSYYNNSWKAALRTNPHIVSITSFNEWHEGTQIERAVPKSFPGLIYKDYKPQNPDYYLTLTKKYVDKFGAMQQGNKQTFS